MSDRPLRVLHLIDHMGSGGAQRVVLDLLESREAPSDCAAVVSLRSHCLPELRQRMEDAGIVYRGLGLSRGNPLPLTRLRAALRRAQPQVLHTHLEFSNALGVLAARSLGRSRPRSIVHVHNDPVRHYSRFHRRAGRLLASSTDVHLVPSAYLAEATGAAFGASARRIEVIPYGIHPAWLERGARQGSRGRGSPPVIGTVARLAPQKSLHHLIQAMPRVLAERPDARLRIFGDGPLRAQLEATARDLGIAGAVELAGFAPDPAAAYATLDVFVLPSQSEGVPISLLEVMAMGIPVVGSRIPGITELVHDERTGLVVGHGDPAGLAHAVLRLLSDPALRDRLRAEARRQVARRYTRDVVSQRIEALYTDLCDVPLSPDSH